MTKVAIVTDTDSSLPADLAVRHGIHQVPINIHFEGETLKSNEDIDDTQLFDRIDREGKLPTTSAPSPGQFAEAFRAAFEVGADAVACFCVSGEISATYGAAIAASDMMPDDLIEVVDTRTLTMGQGFMVLAAAQAAQSGASLEQVIASAESVGRRTHLFGALSTLKYLAMSGRVGHLAAGMANLLNVKPIVTIHDGKLDLLEKIRTQSKAYQRVVELMVEAVGGRSVERMALVHVTAEAEAKQLEQALRVALPCPDECIYAELTPGMSVHTGKGFVGAICVTSE